MIILLNYLSIYALCHLVKLKLKGTYEFRAKVNISPDYLLLDIR